MGACAMQCNALINLRQAPIPPTVRITPSWKITENWTHFSAMVGSGHVNLQIASFFPNIAADYTPDRFLEFAAENAEQAEATT